MNNSLKNPGPAALSWFSYLGFFVVVGESCSLPPKAESPEQSEEPTSSAECGKAVSDSGTPHALGASGLGRYNLVSKQNFSLLLKVKSCAEFLTQSKTRIQEYEKEVRMSLGLCL